MITDPNFHRTAVFGKHVQSDGSQIAPGSPDPLNAGYLQAPPGFPTGLLTHSEGIAYAAVEFYTKRPVQANTGRLQLDFTLADMGSFYTDSQVKETDTKLCIGGKMFNFSAQRIAKTNMMQISNQPGNWVDTGFIAPPFVPGVPLAHSFVYGFDVVTGRYAFQEMTIGGVPFVIPFLLEELVDIATTWPDSAYLQLQDCQGPNGGRAIFLWDCMTYTWY